MAKRWEWLDAETWDAIADQSPGATWFHTRAWSEATAHTDSRYRARGLGLRLSSGELCLFPLVVRAGALRVGPLGRAVSTQPGTYGGPLLAERLLTRADWVEVLEILGEVPLGRIDCFGNVQDPVPSDLVARFRPERRSTHVIELGSLPEDPLTTYRSTLRNEIRRSLAAGVTCRPIATDAELAEYFEVYQERLASWGKTPDKGIPFAMFEFLRAAPGAEIWCAFNADGAVAAGGIFLFTRRHCVWWQGAVHGDMTKLFPSKALIHHLVGECRERGLERLDFNPSSGIGGVDGFKRAFRPTEIEFDTWQHFSPLVSRIKGQ